jgi:hypothetical protein
MDINIKHYIVVLFLALWSATTSAQIMLSPVFDSDIDGLNENNISVVEGRLRSIISSLGMESGYGGRFVLACKISAIQREVSGTKLIQHLQVSFAVGDNMNNVCFGSTTTECIGMGNIEQQAMTSALKNIKCNMELKNLIATGKKRIIEYYDKNIDVILQKTRALVTAHKWEEALYELTPIPQECTFYPEALNMMEDIYRNHINHDAMQVLNEAQAIWSADPNPGPAAEQALSILANIDTSAKCYPQAKALMNKISARVKSVTDQERRNEHEMERARLNAATSLTKARLDACRDVAVAYAKRTVVVYNHYRTWW